MSIKLLVLETGETVIGDIKEVMDKEKDEALGYNVESPYTIDFMPGSTQNLDEQAPNPDDVPQGDIGFRFWAPMSADRDFQFTYNFVRVVYTPHADIISAYLNVIARYQAENTVEINPDMGETVVSENPAENADGNSGVPGTVSPTDLANQPDMPEIGGEDTSQNFEMNTPQ